MPFFQKLTKFDTYIHTLVSLLLEYLNLSLMKPFFSEKSKYLTMSCSDEIGTEKMDVFLAILEVISFSETFFGRKLKIFLLKFFCLKPDL